MKIISYILYLYLLAFHQVILSGIIDIYGAAVDLAALMVVMIALYKSETTALWFAACAAIILGASQPELMPWEILILASGAVFTNQLSLRINLDSISSRIIILGSFVLLHNLIINFVIYSTDFVVLTFRIVLPSAIYTILVGWIIFLIIDGRLTWPKIRALF